MFVLGTIIISSIFSLIFEVILQKGDKSLKVVLEKFIKDKKYFLINLGGIIIVSFMSGIMKYTPYSIVLLSILLVFYKIVVIDIKEKVINMKLYIVLLVISLLSLFTDNGEAFWNSLITGVALFALFWIISKVTKEALGKGDAMVIGALGIIFGFQGICGILLVASLITSLISIIFLVKSFSNKNRNLAFTPYIYLSMLLLIFLNNY